MRKNKVFIFLLIAVIAGGGLFLQSRMKRAKPNGEIIMEVKPTTGSIGNTISVTGTVLPKNRLEIKPSVGGRIDEILVKEGEDVKTGQTLGWMSSTERAALLDAARGESEEALKYWKEVYKAIPLISPIDGEIIVSKMQPGQTVTTADAVLVLSDQLIVRAQVDETDIGKVKEGQQADVALDAYSDTKINSKVDHIYYESKTVNNVTMYEVDLLPDNIPGFFRSGMNATIDFKEKTSENALLLPAAAVIREKDGNFVMIKNNGQKEHEKRAVKIGLSDDKNIEILSGIGLDDTVIVKTRKYALPTSGATGTNPFMPSRGGRGR